jgi:quercetin dioxygenase-like cupin family protein
MVMNWLEPGMEVRPHSHPFEQLAYILAGRVRFTVGDEVVEVGAGEVLRIPPDVVHCGEPIGSETAINLDVFAPVRDDYRHLTEYQESDFSDPD